MRRREERHRPTRGVPEYGKAKGQRVVRPTEAQLWTLAGLGVTTPPFTKAEAAELITKLQTRV